MHAASHTLNVNQLLHTVFEMSFKNNFIDLMNFIYANHHYILQSNRFVFCIAVTIAKLFHVVHS